jgi:hypothetical protein
MKNTIHIDVKQVFDAVKIQVDFEDADIYETEIQMREKDSGRKLIDLRLLAEILVHRMYQAMKPFEGENVTATTKVEMNKALDECLFGEWD